MARRTKLAPAPTAPRAVPVRSVRPDPAAWHLAMYFAEGDVKRLKVIDESTVLVRNS